MALTAPYEGYLKADLEAEADARGIDRSDDPLKADLISRLEAYDSNQAAGEEPVAQTTQEQEAVAAAAEEPVSAPILPETDVPPEPLPTEVEALGAVQQRVQGHQPTPYPSEQDLRNRLVNAFTSDLSPNPPPIEDLTAIGEVNIGEVTVSK